MLVVTAGLNEPLHITHITHADCQLQLYVYTRFYARNDKCVGQPVWMYVVYFLFEPNKNKTHCNHTATQPPQTSIAVWPFVWWCRLHVVWKVGKAWDSSGQKPTHLIILCVPCCWATVQMLATRERTHGECISLSELCVMSARALPGKKNGA